MWHIYRSKQCLQLLSLDRVEHLLKNEYSVIIYSPNFVPICMLLFVCGKQKECFLFQLFSVQRLLTVTVKLFFLFHRTACIFGVTYSQVRWPILRICALQLTHPKCTHTQQWTHTHRWGFGVLLKGSSGVVLKVERALYIHPPPPPTIPAGSETQTRNL